jgi:CHAT domain-containing protein
MKRTAAALLVLGLLTCHRVRPDSLYAHGRQEIEWNNTAAAEQIALQGQTRFASDPYWHELFAILEAESVARTDSARAKKILQEMPATGAPLPSVRRAIVDAKMQRRDDVFLKADALAARMAPELRPEIAMLRASLFFNRDKLAAERCAREAIGGAFPRRQWWVLACAYSILGSIAHGQQHWPEAIGYHSRSLTFAQAARYTRGEMTARVNLGWCYKELGNFDQALENLGPALILAEKGSDRINTQKVLTHIADIYDRRLEPNEALKYAHRALDIACELGNQKELANSYHQLSQIELDLGHDRAAAEWIDRALATRSNEPDGVLTDRFVKARILSATGDPAGALKILDDVLASRNPEPKFAMRWRAQGIKADIYAKLGSFQEAEQMYEETFATGARARESVKGSELVLDFERNLLSFYDGYIQLMLDAKRPADALRVAERSRARGLREAAESPSTAEVDPMALARANNATILCYWLGARRSLLWTVTPDSIDVTKLPAADDIDRAADAYRNEVQSPRHSLATSKRGQELYAMLVAPAKIAPSSRVIVLADSHLNALSFDALIVPGTPPHYWLEDVTVSYSPSLHQLASTPPWKAVRDPRLLVFGAVPAAGPEFPPLLQAKAEIDNVTRHFARARAVVLTGTAATPSSYTAAQPKGFPFIHFAAHATGSTGVGLDSSVILAPDKDGFRLYGRRIAEVPLSAELVTISSCNSAGRRNYAGEGLVGLAWAFLRAGAHRVVAAQSEVSDSAAPRLMDAMYGAIGQGMEPAEALRQAKLKLLHSDFKSPRYWAPFAVYGAM